MKNLKLGFVYTLISVLVLLSFQQKGTHLYESTEFTCKYQTLDGRIHGKYSSYYPNGNLKATGVFENNYRKGRWTVYDERGKKLLQRDYSSPFTCKQVYPAPSKNSSFAFELKRDSNDCFKHHDIKEEKVLMAFRLYRKIEPTNNPLLFAENGLFSLISNQVLNHQVKAYANDSLVRTVMATKIDARDFELVAYKTMEDYYIDSDRLASEFYSIALCPLVRNKNTGDTTELYWVRLDDMRKYLAKVKTGSIASMPLVTNLDDVFFFHSFYGEVIKSFRFEEDKRKPNASFDPMNKSLRVDLELINNEVDFMLYEWYNASQAKQ